jgi:hypothetical protein
MPVLSNYDQWKLHSPDDERWGGEQEFEEPEGRAYKPLILSDAALAEWITEHAQIVNDYPNGSVLWQVRLMHEKLDQIVAALRRPTREAAMRQILQTLIDNDPSEPIADNGMTVLDGLRDEARRLLPSTNKTE